MPRIARYSVFSDGESELPVHDESEFGQEMPVESSGSAAAIESGSADCARSASRRQSKIKVLYIAGESRSGSTILDNILGQIDGFVAVGEIRYAFDRGLRENRLCGCNTPFADCRFWRHVFREAYGGMQAIDAERMFHVYCDGDRASLSALTTIAAGRRWLREHRLAEYLDNLSRLYDAVHTVTGCHVIVDSSKNPSYGHLLTVIPYLEIYVLHLVRDPRAVAFSNQRAKPLMDNGPDDRFATISSSRSALRWIWRNAGSEVLRHRLTKRWMRLRYEDFLVNPEASVRKIVELVGERFTGQPFIDPHQVMLRPTHSVSGNPVRLHNGIVKLRVDDEWKRSLPAAERALVGCLTLAGLIKYHFPVFASPRPIDHRTDSGGC
jgi:Sulfotransferase family